MIMVTSETGRFTAQTQLQSVVYVVVANLPGRISHGIDSIQAYILCVTMVYHEVVIEMGKSPVQVIHQFLCALSAVVEAYLQEWHLLVHPVDQGAGLVTTSGHVYS